jgi:NADH:ubiquinone oxidoreductase subunit E
MIITICIGSSCHLKGSRQIVEQMQQLVKENNLGDKIELKGAFCTGNCMKGVCLSIGEETFSLTPENTKAFFETDVLTRLK